MYLLECSNSGLLQRALQALKLQAPGQQVIHRNHLALAKVARAHLQFELQWQDHQLPHDAAHSFLSHISC